MVAALPCCYSTVPLKPFSATLASGCNPLNTLTHSALYDKALYIPPQWQYLHTAHITSNLTHAATFVSSNMNRDDDVNILPLMTHSKHSVQWPRTGTNVNDALSVSRHHLAKGRGPLLREDFRP